MRKFEVKVECTKTNSGDLVPSAVYWRDGRKWTIEKVLHISSSSLPDSEELRYTVIIEGKEKYIYKKGDIWYVIPEKKGG